MPHKDCAARFLASASQWLFRRLNLQPKYRRLGK